MGLTQPSKATVIFWTADLRVTASTRIVLVMIRAPPWSWIRRAALLALTEGHIAADIIIISGRLR